jgi:hypothetical protein
MSLQGKKLALLIAAAPNEPGFRHGAGVAQAARAGGIDVYLYCIDNAAAGVEALAALDVKLFVCADSAQRRKLPMHPRATYAGLAALSNLIAAADRFVSFTWRMERRVLFIIESDPRVSHRPAEAVRIAAGVAVWKQVEMSLYFRGSAALALGENADELVDGDYFRRFLPLLREADARIVTSGEMTRGELANLAATQTTVTRF